MDVISDSRTYNINPELKKSNKLDSWLKKVLSYPGCDERNLYVNTLSWKTTLFLLIYISIFTAGILIFAPQARLYIQFVFE